MLFISVSGEGNIKHEKILKIDVLKNINSGYRLNCKVLQNVVVKVIN